MSASIAMQFYVAYHDRNLDLLDDLLAPTYVAQVNGREIIGVAAAKGLVAVFLAAFPDVQYTIQDMVADGGKVTIRWTATATHVGPFMGIEPSYKQVHMLGITIFQIAGQQIAALWNVWDVAGLLQQIGR